MKRISSVNTIISIHKLLNQKELVAQDIVKQLNQLKKDDLELYYLLKGKFLGRQKRLEKAECTLVKIKEKFPEVNAKLYQLSLAQDHLDNAIYYLTEYHHYNKNINCSVAIELLKEIQKLQQTPNDYFNDKTILETDHLLLSRGKRNIDLDKSMITFYNESNYYGLIGEIIKAKKTTKNKYRLHEFSILEKLLIKIINQLLDLNIHDIDKDYLSSYIEVMNRNQLIDEDKYLILVNQVIEVNDQLAVILLKEFISNHNVENLEIQINHLYKKIDEKRIYRNLSFTEKECYHFSIKEIRRRIKNGSYHTAMNYCNNCINEKLHPIFNYYMGKSLYKKRRFREAQYYFDEYIKEGGEKEAKACMYLEHIRYMVTREQNSNLYVTRINKINKLEKNDFVFIPIKMEEETILGREKEQEELKQIKRIKSLFSTDPEQAKILLSELTKKNLSIRSKQKIYKLKQDYL